MTIGILILIIIIVLGWIQYLLVSGYNNNWNLKDHPIVSIIITMVTIFLTMLIFTIFIQKFWNTPLTI